MALISDNIKGFVNLRIKNEEQSSRIYAAMSNWADLNGFSGATKLLKKYSEEELIHANWARQYMLDRNILPVTPSQEEPKQEFKGLPQIIALGYEHETQITNECLQFGKECLKEGDLMTFGLAQKYIDEQIGELAKFQYYLDKLETFGTDKIALRLLDQEMGG